MTTFFTCPAAVWTTAVISERHPQENVKLLFTTCPAAVWTTAVISERHLQEQTLTNKTFAIQFFNEKLQLLKGRRKKSVGFGWCTPQKGGWGWFGSVNLLSSSNNL